MDQVKIYGLTDVGIVREKNEDSFIIKDYGDSILAVVADGISGMSGGKLASATAVEMIEREYEANRGMPAKEIVEQAMIKAHQRIRAKAEAEEGTRQMGTTCTTAILTAPKPAIDSSLVINNDVKAEATATVGHIGDSKVFQIRDDMIVQRTKDHTMLADLIEQGSITQAEAPEFAHKNVLTKSLGATTALELDPPTQFAMKKGDIILLCSDGLSDLVSPDEIITIIKGTDSVKSAAEYMVNLAKYRGGDDNITLLFAEYGEHPRLADLTLEDIPEPKKNVKEAVEAIDEKEKRVTVIALLAVLIILVSSLATFLVLQGDFLKRIVSGIRISRSSVLDSLKTGKTNTTAAEETNAAPEPTPQEREYRVIEEKFARLKDYAVRLGYKEKEPFVFLSIETQKLYIISNDVVTDTYRVSTAEKGIGAENGSSRTPPGFLRIDKKIGKGVPIMTVFRGRRATSEIYDPETSPSRNYTLTRMFMLEGLERGVNKGRNAKGVVVDTKQRLISIAGTQEEHVVRSGIPSSPGGIRMLNDEIIEFFKRIPIKTIIYIETPGESAEDIAARFQ